jgi:hypothetical protein
MYREKLMGCRSAHFLVVKAVSILLPDLSLDQRLLGNLRRARLEIEELGLQLDEVIVKFDEEIRQQRMKRVQQSLNLYRENPSGG